MVAAYPFMKRFTWWPQIFLGVTFNLGVLIAWCAVTADWGATPFLIYLAAIFWTFGYDTIYAHQDKEDDAAIGVKSSARRLGAATLPVTRFCYVMASVALIIAGLIENAGWLFWPIILAFLLLQLKSLKGLNLDHRQQCHQAFRLNRLTGALPALAWLAS
jgi:4-hydroxybenzoate polyprenyltransferase